MKNKTSGIFATIFFTLISILFVSPILIVLMNSFKKKAFISLEPFKLPNEKSYVGLENYLTSISKYDFIKAVGWTVFITVLSVIVILVCCSMCAWYITRVQNKITKLIYLLCVFSMVIPFQMVMFTLSGTADTLGLNTPWGLIIVYLGFGAGLAVFMSMPQFCRVFEKSDTYFNGYFSNEKITDIEEAYIASTITQDDLTKISRQLKVSMGSMMGLVNGFAIMIYMIVIYLLSKIIIEKNAQSISMTKILGYTNGEISRFYIMSTMVVVVIELLLSLPIETVVMNVIFRVMMMESLTGWITLWIDPKIYVEMFLTGFITYGVVALLEYRKIKKVPMDEALKKVE